MRPYEALISLEELDHRHYLGCCLDRRAGLYCYHCPQYIYTFKTHLQTTSVFELGVHIIIIEKYFRTFKY